MIEKEEYDKLLEERNNMRALLRKIVIDVEEMRHKEPKFPHYFGPFSKWYEDVHEDGLMHIEWPNLGILIDQAKELWHKSS